MWIWLVLLYGVFKGLREVCKKKAMQTNSPLEVLLVHTAISFLMVVPDVKNAIGMPSNFFLPVALKSFVIFLAWILSFYVIKKIPISLFGVLNLSRVLFGTLLGVTILGESLTVFQIIGCLLVCTGLLSLKINFSKRKKSDIEETSNEQANIILSNSSNQLSKKSSIYLYVVLAFLSCFFNAISGFMDKILMKDITSSQLQFWYMLFLFCYYIIFVLITRQKICLVSALKNKWVWILSLLFIVADRSLFIANGIEESKVTIMTLLKQSGVIVSILAGKFVFKEKNILHKLFCACIIICGIVIGVL